LKWVTAMGGGHSQNKGHRSSMRQNFRAHILRMPLGSLVIARTMDTSKPLKMFNMLMHWGSVEPMKIWCITMVHSCFTPMCEGQKSTFRYIIHVSMHTNPTFLKTLWNLHNFITQKIWDKPQLAHNSSTP
jgi:hypothetical protein